MVTVRDNMQFSGGQTLLKGCFSVMNYLPRGHLVGVVKALDQSCND